MNLKVLKKVGYKRVDKKVVIDPATKGIIERIFELYLQGKSYQTIANIFNEEKLLFSEKKKIKSHIVEIEYICFFKSFNVLLVEK